MKIVKLYNSGDFFRGFFQLGLDWKIQGFKEIVEDKTGIKEECFNIFPAILYFYMIKTHGCKINLKIFKESILNLKEKSSIKFKFITDNFEGGEDLEISEELFDKTMNFLFKVKMIEKYNVPFIEPNPKYFILTNSVSDYCRKLGNYLFNTEYARRSYKSNIHYFNKINKVKVKTTGMIH